MYVPGYTNVHRRAGYTCSLRQNLFSLLHIWASEIYILLVQDHFLQAQAIYTMLNW